MSLYVTQTEKNIVTPERTKFSKSRYYPQQCQHTPSTTNNTYETVLTPQARNFKGSSQYSVFHKCGPKRKAVKLWVIRTKINRLYRRAWSHRLSTTSQSSTRPSFIAGTICSINIRSSESFLQHKQKTSAIRMILWIYYLLQTTISFLIWAQWDPVRTQNGQAKS